MGSDPDVLSFYYKNSEVGDNASPGLSRESTGAGLVPEPWLISTKVPTRTLVPDGTPTRVHLEPDVSSPPGAALGQESFRQRSNLPGSVRTAAPAAPSRPRPWLLSAGRRLGAERVRGAG